MRVYIGPYRNYNKRTKETPERKVRIQLHKYDTWSMDHTLALIIHPMLLQLKATKHGAPFTDNADVPEHLRSTSPPVDEKNTPSGDYDGVEAEINIFARWNWILDEMIWAFAQEINEEAEEQFYSGEAHHMWVPLDEKNQPLGEARESADRRRPPKGTKFWKMVKGPNDTFIYDVDAHRLFEDRKRNGFRLFGKYYGGLWD